MPKKIIHFAAGAKTSPRSGAAFLKVHKNNIYLSITDLSGTIKFSFHKDRWYEGFTKESGRISPLTGQKTNRDYPMPGEYLSGWTLGATISVPWVEWNTDLKPKARYHNSTLWFKGPHYKKRLNFQVVIGSKLVQSKIITTAMSRGEWTDGLVLSDGRTVCLQVVEDDLSKQDIKFVKELNDLVMDKLKKQYRKHQKRPTLEHPWASDFVRGEHNTAKEDLPLIVQVPLGKEHFNVK